MNSSGRSEFVSSRSGKQLRCQRVDCGHSTNLWADRPCSFGSNRSIPLKKSALSN